SAPRTRFPVDHHAGASGGVMAAEDYPGRRVMEALGHGIGPENVKRDMIGLFGNYEAEGRRSAQLPLIAINEIVAERIETLGKQDVAYGSMDPWSKVEVPWWTLWALSQFWSAYTNSQGRRALGQAFGVEATRQGERSSIKTRKTQQDRMGYALEVAWERHCNPNLSVE